MSDNEITVPEALDEASVGSILYNTKYTDNIHRLNNNLEFTDSSNLAVKIGDLSNNGIL